MNSRQARSTRISLLALEQRRPGRVIVARVARPRLLDDRRRVDRHGALVGLLMFDAARLCAHGGDRDSCEDGDLSTGALNRSRPLRFSAASAHPVLGGPETR